MDRRWRAGARAGAIELSGAEMVVRALKDQGVKHIFGYPGGAVLPIYDALFASTTISSMCWCATSRARCMRPKAMRARRASRASCW
jgi:glyoxylate carboligase